MCETLQALKEQLTDVENESTNTESGEVYEAAEPALLTMPVEVKYHILHAQFFNIFSVRTLLKSSMHVNAKC